MCVSQLTAHGTGEHCHSELLTRRFIGTFPVLWLVRWTKQLVLPFKQECAVSMLRLWGGVLLLTTGSRTRPAQIAPKVVCSQDAQLILYRFPRIVAFMPQLLGCKTNYICSAIV